MNIGYTCWKVKGYIFFWKLNNISRIIIVVRSKVKAYVN